MKKIILIGYMGSGKSTIAKLLSKSINFGFQDLDETIEKELNLSVVTIFEQKGEVYFRKLEHEVLKKIVQSDDNMILSLGGGTPCFTNNQELLYGEGITTIYLKASVDKLYERLRNQKINRPLIANKNEGEMKEFIAKHLFERSFYYNKAKYTILTDNKSPQETVSEIKAILV
ncbi:shikimate kinase [Flavobacterium psychrotolerans]|uniref:Shikimate kinase n=1 Tax=Flavobacterium psychrotolerans TaxID=2169410 RepID=A0A2U1JK34_9FLAO|nr:shikimate kinase [Flavobacterium psychrotolerans]PWA05349.1 shikimate kinase [Flavobacterium psychrotolerans]